MRNRCLSAFLFAVTLSVGGLLPAVVSAQLTDYMDAPGYPAPWPGQLDTQAYTRLGQPQYDLEKNPDNSRGATPTGSADFSSNGGNETSFFYYADGTTLFFRFRVAGPPVKLNPTNGAPFTSETWNVLFDVNGDGWKDFVLQVYGGDGSNQNPVDDMLILWDDQLSQSFTIGFSNVWKQDSVRHPSDSSMSGTNGEPGSPQDWDADPDPYTWDFGRTRVVQIDQSRSPGTNNSEYFVDLQIPLAMFNANALGGPALNSGSPYSLSATTSNSNTDPTQKDLLFAGDFALGDVPLPGGDITNPDGTIFQAPVIREITATSCPSAELVVNVMDTLDVSGGVTVDTLSSVVFEYYYDADGDALPDDGYSWKPIGNAARTSRLGYWDLTWQTDNLPQGNYLVRAIATDNQGNVTTSTDQPQTFPDGVMGTLDNTCGLPLVSLSGRVFEDFNYGGGAGRSFASASGVGRSNARVELFLANDNFTQAVETDEDGFYTFPALPPSADYAVRVVNETVTSSRGSSTNLLPVQTFRTEAADGTVTAVTDRVGGEDPARVDAPPAESGDTLPGLDAGDELAQSVAAVSLGTGNTSGVDFGFNFNSIVNTRDAGQGSLRQFILNANALGGESSLAQDGLTAGRETSIFMIPSGSAAPGHRAGLAGQLTGGVAVIELTSALPALTSPNTSIDGTVQTTRIGNTNTGVLGTGGNVGSESVALPQVNAPEVQIQGNGAIATGLDVAAPGVTIRGVALFGFGSNPDSAAHANLRVSSGGSGVRIEGMVLGTSAIAFSLPSVALQTGGSNIQVQGAANGTVENSLIGFAGGTGLSLRAGAAGWTVSGSEFRGNGQDSNTADGVRIASGAGANLGGNLVVASAGAGIDVASGAAAVTVLNNTIADNGTAGAKTPGVRLAGTGTLVDRNIIETNAGAGIMVLAGGNANTLTRNSIFGNGSSGSPATGQIGIDLLGPGDDTALGSAPFVSLNDSGDGDTGGNGRLNFPVITGAFLDGGELTLTGFAPGGATLELFVSDNDPSGFGEGETYVASLTEGSAADDDSGSGSYSGVINGQAQGGDTTNRFSFTLSAPAGVSAGTVLTATATVSGSTSEFSGQVTVQEPVKVSGHVFDDVDRDGEIDAGENGTGLTLYAKLLAASSPEGPALEATAIDPGTGVYEFPQVLPGDYLVLVDDNATLGDVTPTLPSGRSGTNFPDLIRPVTVAGGTDVTDVDLGIGTVVLLTGRVFLDTGEGGGIANDGSDNGGETGVGGVTVRLTDNAGSVTHATAVTDGDGGYTLEIPASTASGTSLKIVKTNPSAKIATGASVGTTGGTYNRASDTVTFTYGGETGFSGVDFGVVPENQFLTDGAQTGLPGAVLFYSHTFIAGSAGDVTFTIDENPSPSMPGWSSVIYRDTNNNQVLDAGEPILNGPITGVEAGETISLIVKNYIPVAAPFNAQDQIVVVVDFEYSGATPALSASATRTNLTTVGPTTAGLTLVKSVDKATALPGEVINYTIVFTNNGLDPLHSLSITDRAPAFTSLVGAGPSDLPDGLTQASVITDSPEPGYIRWVFNGDLGPGHSGHVTFSVQLDP